MNDDQQKMQSYDTIISDARFQYDFWRKFWKRLERKDTPTGGFAEGMIHAARNVLHRADVEVDCPCAACEDQKQALLRETCIHGDNR